MVKLPDLQTNELYGFKLTRAARSSVFGIVWTCCTSLLSRPSRVHNSYSTALLFHDKFCARVVQGCGPYDYRVLTRQQTTCLDYVRRIPAGAANLRRRPLVLLTASCTSSFGYVSYDPRLLRAGFVDIIIIKSSQK